MRKVDTILDHAKKQMDFNKLCNEYEKLEPELRGYMILEKAKKVHEHFLSTSRNASEIVPANALTAIMMNATVVGGVNKNEHMKKIAPYLDKIFGGDQEFNAIRLTYMGSAQGLAQLDRYVSDVIQIVHAHNKSLELEIMSLCMLIMSSDGRISLKERKYLKQQFGYLQPQP